MRNHEQKIVAEAKKLYADRQEKIPRGRGYDYPYNEEEAAAILDMVATLPMSLAQITKENSHLPCERTVYKWIWKYPEFGERYMQAKRSQITALTDKMHDELEYSELDLIHQPNGSITSNSARLERSKMKLKTYQWMASKLMPMFYGDQLTLHVNEQSRSALEAKKKMELIKQKEKDF